MTDTSPERVAEVRGGLRMERAFGRAATGPVCSDAIALIEALAAERDALAARSLDNEWLIATLSEALWHFWHSTGSCPCGARREAPDTHPHTMGCPVGVALDALNETGDDSDDRI